MEKEIINKTLGSIIDDIEERILSLEKEDPSDENKTLIKENRRFLSYISRKVLDNL